MTQEILLSPAITNLNTFPVVPNTAGEGGPGILRRVVDTVTTTAVGMATIGSAYRLCRFPTGARIQGFRVDLGIVDSGGATAVFDFNVAFSDSLTQDGTPSIYLPTDNTTTNETASLCIPKTTQAGGTPTSVTTYSTPNLMFGQITVGNNAVKLNNDQLFAGSYAAGTTAGTIKAAWRFGGPNYPMWAMLGYLVDPGGYFDILAYLSTAATTGAAGQIHGQLDFIY
jgi:hypothetical protein